MKRFFLLAMIALFIFTIGTINAGPLLDDLLNYPIIDQKCPGESVQEEGMGLVSKGKAKFIELREDQPLGQTFQLGPKANKIWRIQVGICHWPDSWTKDEKVTFTLWDSPAKKCKYFSRTYSYAEKWFKWDVAINLHIPARPNGKYYYELTYGGSGDGRINVAYIPSDDYKRGEAYVAGKPRKDFDFYFVVITKPKGDRKANLERFFSNFDFSYPPLQEAGKAYEKGDYELAGKLILKHFESRTQPDVLVSPVEIKPDFDTKRMDLLADRNLLRGEDGEGNRAFMRLDEYYTWREVWPNTAEYVRMNDIFWYLGLAYNATGNEKYAKKLNDLMIDYMQDNASPYDGGMRGGRWVAMFQAWRLGDAWDGWGLAFKSKSLQDDVKLAWLDYWCRMAHFAQNDHSGGNHANAVGQALISFSKRFPEFKRSKEWFNFGFDKLVNNSLVLFREDGGCVEPAMNYHGFSLGNLISGVNLVKEVGVEVPEHINKVIEKALVYTSYMLDPSGQAPALGDSNAVDFRPVKDFESRWRTGEPKTAYEMFGRKDCLYIATLGKEGERPDKTAYAFPNTGHYIMRSDWGEDGKKYTDARWLLLRAGTFGSHGHWDLNSIVLYAYGRQLLIDPGRTTYGTPLMYELTEPKSHNVLLVDDHKQQQSVNPQMNLWSGSPVMDIADCTYKGLYPGVDHRRAVVFVRPDYYILFDEAISDKSHKYGVNFWLTPPDLTIDKSGFKVCTNEPDGSNIVIKLADSEGAEIVERKGTMDVAGGIREDIPVITFIKNAERASFTTILYPFPQLAEMDKVDARSHNLGNGQVCVVTSSSNIDYVCYARQPELCSGAGVAFYGSAAIVRTTDGKNVTSCAIVNGNMLKFGDIELISSEKPVKNASVRYTSDTVIIDFEGNESGSISIAALGRTKALVNGSAQTVQNGIVKIMN